MKTMIVFAFLLVVVAATMEERLFQGSEDFAIKRGVNKDTLSTVSCRYLKTNGYLARDAKWRKLCLRTYYCNDLFSKNSCTVAKARNECAKDTKLSLTYCPFTCNKCGVVMGNPRPQCKKSVPQALGMQSKAIPNSKITASSYWSTAYPSNARLRLKMKSDYAFWAPKYNRVGQWLQVDLTKITKVTAIATQGNGHTSAQDWTKSYSLQYSLNGSTLKNYQGGKVFKGNTDKNTVVKNALIPPIIARYIRLVVKSWNSGNWPVIRMELYGCK